MEDSDEYFARRSEIVEITSRISETSRLIGFGLIALSFSIHGSESGILIDVRVNSEILVNVFGTIGFLVILFDYSQYLFALMATQRALSRHENDYSFDRRWISYKLWRSCFWIKQILCLLGVVLSMYSFLSVILK